MDGPWFACPACGGKEFEFAQFEGVEYGGLAECQGCGAQFRDGDWYANDGASVSYQPLELPVLSV